MESELEADRKSIADTQDIVRGFCEKYGIAYNMDNMEWELSKLRHDIEDYRELKVREAQQNDSGIHEEISLLESRIRNFLRSFICMDDISNYSLAIEKIKRDTADFIRINNELLKQESYSRQYEKQIDGITQFLKSYVKDYSDEDSVGEMLRRLDKKLDEYYRAKSEYENAVSAKNDFEAGTDISLLAAGEDEDDKVSLEDIAADMSQTDIMIENYSEQIAQCNRQLENLQIQAEECENFRQELNELESVQENEIKKERLLKLTKQIMEDSKQSFTAKYMEPVMAGVRKYFKILAGYHQYFAVRKAIESTKHATVTDGKGGVFWHTQGSGKSLSMVFYAHLLQEALDSPTIVVITDRNDLDNQLYGQFAKCKEFLRQEPIHAESRENLKSLLAGRQANGIIFTTMQKFEESHEALSERNNIIVMADEAHRGQYGLAETVDAKTGKIKIGTARIIRNTLPNATYIGFTGTPISSKDRSTREVFGDYIDIYDMTQAVEDGATRPVYYESRVIKLNLDEDTLRLIDSEYDIMAENADGEVVEKSKRELGKMEAVLGNDNTINSLVCDILDHYENNRENLLTGKAMIVAYSRPIAMKIYKRILELRPAWTEKVGVVMTSGNNDPEEWRKIIGNKHHKDELAKKFKDNNSPMKIAIVVDMWLTGFDVPSLATMYVYKPMSGHNLMQAIARVNRVFRDKEGGLVVDYVGIASALKQAMNDYTSRDRKNYGDTDVAKVAYPKFLEKLSVCRDMFHGYDYSKFTGGTDLERAKTISGAVNFIMDREKVDDKDSFVKEALMLHQALSLCSSLVDEESRFEAAFFESVRVLVLRLTNTGVGKKISLPEMNARINELLKQSIKSDGVINLFSDIKEEFSLFDPKFLEEVANMKEKNLAIELLKKLIAEQVSVYRRTNVVKSEKFSEIMQRSLNAYLNGMLTNEEVIEEMLNLAKQIAAAKKEGDQLGLTADELAFYDALTKPQAIKDLYENEELIAITKELADTLRRNKTIDWQKRESARAKMRMLIKKLLKKHKYPPEGMEDAVQTVMTQCELWTDNNDMENYAENSKVYTYSLKPELSMVAEDTVPYGK